MTIRASLALLGIAIVLTGCTAPALTLPDPPPALTEQEKVDLHSAGLDERWEDIAARFPDAVRPEVQLVRYIDQEEWAQVMVDCLTAEGMNAKVSTDGQGGFESHAAVGQELAMEVAQYVCDAKYPTDPSLNQPLTDAEFDYLYDYYVQILSPCLEAEGYKVSEPPSRQAFLDTYGTKDTWAPYNAVKFAGQDEWNRINRACPQGPPGLRTGG